MERKSKPGDVTAAANLYLDSHLYSLEAQLHVRNVLAKFEFLVDLAISRAISDLEVPQNVVFMPVREQPDTIA